MSTEDPNWEPPPPPPPPEAPATKRRGRVRLAGIGLALAVVGATAGFIVTRVGATSLASTTATTPSPSPSGQHNRPSFGGGGFGFGFGCGGGGFTSAGFGFAGASLCGGDTGTITKISGGTLTLRTLAGSVTVTTSTATKYSREGRQVKFSAVKVGEVVAVRGSRTGTTKTASSPIAATAVTIEVPSISGRVQSVSGNTITLVTGNGQLEYVTTSGSTAYQGVRGATASSSSIKAGVYLIAEGTQTDLTHLSADQVQVLGNFSAAPRSYPGHFGGAPAPRPSAPASAVN
jgi:hypothetical protein